MRTFLITWNPDKWTWAELAECVDAVQAGTPRLERWSTGQRKDIEPGDRLFLLRQGKEPRGIVGSGWASSGVFQAPHWGDPARLANYVEFRFDRLLDADVDLPLATPFLQEQPDLADVHWAPQGSGILVPDNAAASLEAFWASHYAGLAAPPEDENVGPPSPLQALEGAITLRLQRHRRRERSLRRAKIAAALSLGPLRCEVPGCGFDFARTYGALGEGFAHVHHLRPLGDRDAATPTSTADLAIVCANCHAMIHHGGECRPLEGLIAR